MKLIINSNTSYSDAISTLRDLYQKHKYLIASIRIGKDRSLDQNATSFLWYSHISKQLGEDTPEGVRCECKLRYGIPILAGDDPEFAAMFQSTFGNLSYEKQLEAMRWLDVTSLFTVPQFSRYLDTMQKDYLTRGVILEAN